MCRLLGFCARDGASLAEIMGERGLRAFTGLSAFHGDGWGMAWYDERELHAEKSPRRALDEPAFTELAHRRLGDLGLVHLRWATPGLPVEPRNTHPFRRGHEPDGDENRQADHERDGDQGVVQELHVDHGTHSPFCLHCLLGQYGQPK